jgi:murein DD-endopeptidase MepM/ murein hydrolase activator NlpD
MPLDYTLKWLVTTEVGGYDCMGAYDQYHDTNNYFSIDFSWRNKDANGAQVFPNPDPAQNKANNGVYIPVRAAASGVVLTSTSDSANGNYVVIDHDWDSNVNTGFQTRYLHLQPGWVVAQGASVQYGEVIGYMGNTGISNGAHLHFGVRYGNDGSKTVNALAKVVLENKLLKSYQTECSVNSGGVPNDWNRYYP